MFYNIDYYEPRVNILYHRNMTPPPHFICLRQLAECGPSNIFSMKLDTKLNTGVGASIKTICQLSNVSLKRRSFTGKKYYGITIILLMYQSAMLYKYGFNPAGIKYILLTAPTNS